MLYKLFTAKKKSRIVKTAQINLTKLKIKRISEFKFAQVFRQSTFQCHSLILVYVYCIPL